jgi:3-hydroxybutyryl-CoA dehydrogenase
VQIFFMRIVVLANEDAKAAWLPMIKNDAPLQWVAGPDAVPASETADVVIDLLPEAELPVRLQLYATKITGCIIANSVVQPTAALSSFCGNIPLVRINAWPGFLHRSVLEVAGSGSALQIAAGVFDTLGCAYQTAPDIPGLISARIISMIVNEAYFALGDGVSTKAEIDTAMKLGTNYPKGPFEWSAIIGLENIYTLLEAMSGEELRCAPAPAMKAALNL